VLAASLPFVATWYAAAPAHAGSASAVVPGQVVVSGTVPDEVTKAAILTRLREVYGADRILDNLGVGQVVVPANWSQYAQKLITPELKTISRGQVSLDGNRLTLTGEVDSDSLRQRLANNMAASLNSSYVVKNGLRVASTDQSILDKALANRIVEFESGSATLTGTGIQVLEEMLPPLRKLTGKKIEIIGHTDNLGRRDANIALSAARADTVQAFLVSRGVPLTMLTTTGMGPDRPVASNTMATGRARNRRIEFRVTQ
jgi:OOP family OmpA-OmpF porin